MKDFKYLAAYFIPLVTILAIELKGFYSFLTVILVFVLIPLIEPFTAKRESNYTKVNQETRKGIKLFDILLYLNVPIVLGTLAFFLFEISQHSLQIWEVTGLILSVGILMGGNGINVAHELGHKPEKYKQIMASTLLWPSMYMHFTIEHNMGHHKYVATQKDPATARKNEAVYTFWLRSMMNTYINAWSIEARRLSSLSFGFWSIKNKMLIFSFCQGALLLGVLWWGGLGMLLVYCLTALVSVLLLETINYIEHYGLQRDLLANGRYERVQPKHSWNSNHELGRILLYELTRHSDHHFMANKKYQNLDHHDEAKQLPYGYPASMLLSLCPPLWFRKMNPILS